MTSVPSVAPPVLSTPDTHIFDQDQNATDFTSSTDQPDQSIAPPELSPDQLALRYEINRTVAEIKEGKWRRIALQFPDEMLRDAPRVARILRRQLSGLRPLQAQQTAEIPPTTGNGASMHSALGSLDISGPKREEEIKISILADTSYGACCVDEIAAEHVDADVVVHYGRSCLSPTARLPVIYVFTTRPLDLQVVATAFKKKWPEKCEKVILMADVGYIDHVARLHEKLREEGYENVYATQVVHDPSSPIPNRTVPSETAGAADRLKQYDLFHVAKPPPALVLTLSSRVKSLHIYSTAQVSSTSSAPDTSPATSTATLRRRYALVTRLHTASIFGILINTLSVKNYLHIVSHVKRLVAAAGKKSYTFVVGKVNTAKIANFEEIEGWVVIGCWESSLIESGEFSRPLITPFELKLALMSDEERIWTGEWNSDFQTVLQDGSATERKEQQFAASHDALPDDSNTAASADIDGIESESEPPDFDLRTGRYVSHSRPMRASRWVPQQSSNRDPKSNGEKASASVNALIKRADGELIQVGGEASPGAAFLREKRTWQGLGSDFYEDDVKAEEEAGGESGGGGGAVLEEGRSGIARGYGEESC